jgi:HEAT repeat protein
VAVLGALACIEVRDEPLPPAKLEERNAALVEVEAKLEYLESASAQEAVSLLTHSDHRVRIHAARRLSKIRARDISAIGALENALEDEDRRVRIEVAMALGKIASDEALEVLLRAVVDSEYKVRLWASKGLVRAKAQAVPILVSHLSPDSPLASMSYKDASKRKHSIGEEILNCLKKIGKPAVPALKEMLEGDDMKMRGHAADVLGAIGKEAAGAIPGVVSLTRESVASSVRQKAVKAIGQIGDVDPRVIPTLKKLESDPDENVANAAKAALKALQDKSASDE